MRRLLVAAIALGAAAPAGPWPVTTDTLAYCELLSRRAATFRHPTADAKRLARDGEEMCDHGAVRAGITKLRHALVMMHADHSPPRRF